MLKLHNIPLPSLNTRSTTCSYHLTVNKTCNWTHNPFHQSMWNQDSHTNSCYLLIILFCKWNLPLWTYLIYCRHLQLLENDKVLLVVDDHNGGILVYLNSVQSICAGAPRKSLHRSKIGEACIFTFDEGRRSLAICETNKVILFLLNPSNNY